MSDFQWEARWVIALPRQGLQFGLRAPLTGRNGQVERGRGDVHHGGGSCSGGQRDPGFH